MLLKEELIHARDNVGEEKKRVRVSKILKSLTRERDLIKKQKSSLSHGSGEWLYENYYLIERISRKIMRVLPCSYNRLLPVTDAFVMSADSVDNESISVLFDVLSKSSGITDRDLERVKSALCYSCLCEILRRCRACEELGCKIELLRRVESFDFTPYVQGFSEAERYLRSDPTGTWQKMKAESRELYKTKIRKMARRERVDYTTLCKIISGKACEKSRHIGEFIDFGGGYSFIYYIALGLCFAVLWGLAALFVLSLSRTFTAYLICFTLIIPLFEASAGLVAFLISFFRKSDILPRIELDSVDQTTPTLVALTCLVSKKEELDGYFSHLEKLYLKSRSRKKEDEGLYFGLLCDFPESDTPVCDKDKELVDISQKWVELLNSRYGEHFAFFTRGRVLNKASGRYSGWERKRGALLELSRHVLGRRSSIKRIGADIPRIKYIVTLDSDTDMGIGDLSKMVGTLEHPLNRPVLGERRGVRCVVKGYGILQPLTVPSLSASFKTSFSLLISGAGGFDTYHGPVFDLFHVLHRRAMFCGKGIFDVECYLEVLDNAFPDGIVLSHDMLEGARLRAGFLSDMVFVDSVPTSVISYYKRAHRWARGDVQSLVFTTPNIYDKYGARVKNPMPLAERFVFYNNFLNLISPIFSCLALFLSVTLNGRIATAVLVLSTAPLWIYSVLQLTGMLLRLSFATLFRRFFTEALTGIRRELLHLLYSLASLFFRAWQNYHAILTSLWRLAVTHKKLLEWNTAGDVENAFVKKGGVAAYFLYTLPSFIAGLVFLIVSESGATRLMGVLWCVFFIVGYVTSKKREKRFSLTDAQRKTLISYAERGWRFFERVCAEDNYLPCDNVSVAPSSATAHRTSPTNIGLYLLSLLAARDFGFIDTHTLYKCLDRTLTTVEKMNKHRGHLYNWYDTRTLEIIGQEYISSVDSGNFTVCLVTLAEGLSEYCSEESGLEEIINRCRALEKSVDFKFLYDNRRGLFSIGYNVETGERDRGCYDLYMSEMRTTDYYAVARGIVEKEHWSNLSRSLIARHLLLGSASWSGTAFEFFMPQMFLPVFENSFCDEALGFAFAEQTDYSSGGVWGSSESGYFAFDRDMNYQYRAFGVPSLALCRDVEREKVFSPYSTFLMMSENPSLCIRNLERMKRLGMWGECGFYEAVDFTPSRSGGGFATVKSYMAHHVGMSLVSLANTVFDNAFVKRFMRDAEMGSAVELLQERIPVDALILKNSARREPQPRVSVTLPDTQVLCRNRERNAVTSLAGRDMSVILSESGILEGTVLGVSAFREYMPCIPFCRIGDEYFSPEYRGKIQFTYGKGFARYKCDGADITLSVSSRAPALRIKISPKAQSDCGIYITPCATNRSAAVSHPAYTELFYEGYYENGAVILEYHGKAPFYQCIMSDNSFEFELFRENIFLSCDATSQNLFRYLEKTPRLSGKTGTLLSPCILARKKSCSDALFVVGFGKTSAEAVRSAVCELEKSHHNSISESDRFERGLMSACELGGIDRALNEKLLSCFGDKRVFRISESLPKHYGREKLWETGISGDLPVVSVSASLDADILERIFKHHKLHYISTVRYDLVIVCRDTGYRQSERDRVYKIMDAVRCRFIEGQSGGIFVVGSEYAEVMKYASSVLLDKKSDIIPVTRLEDFLPELTSSEYKKSGEPYGFGDGYIIDKAVYNPEILWHHIIASDTFGTLVSTRGLGHTWVYNAGLSRLGVWENDRVSSVQGEKLYITLKGKTYDACDSAARIEFKAGCAIYHGGFYKVSVACHPTFLYKEVCVDAEDEVTLFYKMKPVMGDGVARAGGVWAEKIGCGMIFSNPFSDTLGQGFGYILSPDAAFSVTPHGLETQGKRVIVGYAGSLEHLDRVIERVKRSGCESVAFAKRFLPKPVDTHFDKNSEYMYNYGLPLQCAVSRILARTGPYQSGGAWGCRDQAQDMLFMIDICPERVKAHLYRIASHQYLEGDMQHWWHGYRGTRTRCSDDYLWFVLLLSEYIDRRDDVGIFEHTVYYRTSPELSERERYEYAARSDTRENLLGHAKRCLDLFVSRGLGKNGLPFMGSGDWNDGMDAVGEGGGESVWLAFFALTVFYKSFPMFERFGVDTSDWRAFCKRLYENVEKNAWFEDRYARAFLGDGTPLGVRGCDECKIDGIVTAFSSICFKVTGLGNTSRISAALDTAWKSLYDEKTGIYKLFAPAFREYDSRVGYVSSYPEGVRENGGQYTHGAVFSALGYLWAPAEKRKNLERAKRILDAILTCNRDPDVLKTEPYVLSADIYSNPTHKGRGGWSFYTGSAGWCRYLMSEIEKEEKKTE